MNDTTQVSKWFETKTRAMDIGGKNGESFVTLTDDSPDWLKEAVRECHDGLMPNDWVFAECEAVCNEWDNERFVNDDYEDEIHEYADGRVDVYTSELFKWASEFCNSNIFAEAEGEMREVGQVHSIETAIKVVQYYAISRLTRTMLEAIKENVATDEE